MVASAAFEQEDFITEPVVFLALREYFKNRGDPDTVIQLLSDNIKGYSQVSVILIKWLLMIGVKDEELREMIDNEIVNLIYQIFDTKNAELLLMDSYESTMNAFLKMNVSPQISTMFRNLFVRYPDSKFLQMITESQDKMANRSKSFKASLSDIGVDRKTDTDYSTLLKRQFKNDEDASSFYLFTSVDFDDILNIDNMIIFLFIPLLSQLNNKSLQLFKQFISILCEPNSKSILRRFIQLQSDVESDVEQSLNIIQSLMNEHERSPINSEYYLDIISNMIVKRPSDVLLDDNAIKIAKIFAKINQVSYSNDYDQESVDQITELANFLDKNDPLRHFIKGMKLIVEIINSNALLTYTIFYMIKVAMGEKLIDADLTDLQPMFYILDKIVMKHPFFMKMNFELLVSLLENSLNDLENLSKMNISKLIIDRLIFLIYCGYVPPVMKYMSKLCTRSAIDMSLIRYFIVELDKFIENIGDKMLESQISAIRDHINLDM